MHYENIYIATNEKNDKRGKQLKKSQTRGWGLTQTRLKTGGGLWYIYTRGMVTGTMTWKHKKNNTLTKRK